MKTFGIYFLAYFLSFLLVTCSPHPKDGSAKIPPSSVGTKRFVPQTVTLYRYGDFPMAKASKLKNELKTYFKKVELKNEALPLNSAYYNKERNRYLAGGLFGELSKRQDGDAVVGITDYVIFKPNNISKTFGIMGLSPVGTYKCVVSSTMPKNHKPLPDDVLLKLTLHELGHAYGLNHCPRQSCYMVDAEHKMKFNQTYGFCNSCKSKLKAKGWIFK